MLNIKEMMASLPRDTMAKPAGLGMRPWWMFQQFVLWKINNLLCILR
jgi:hypothetical protein